MEIPNLISRRPTSLQRRLNDRLVSSAVSSWLESFQNVDRSIIESLEGDYSLSLAIPSTRHRYWMKLLIVMKMGLKGSRVLRFRGDLLDACPMIARTRSRTPRCRIVIPKSVRCVAKRLYTRGEKHVNT